MSSISEKTALAKELAEQGYNVSITNWPNKATYYNADGEPMPDLPADPYNMRKYMRKGFMPFPPKKAEAPVAVLETVQAPPPVEAVTEPALPAVVEVAVVPAAAQVADVLPVVEPVTKPAGKPKQKWDWSHKKPQKKNKAKG